MAAVRSPLPTGSSRRRQVTTALKVLALLRHRAPVALSSFGMGLQIQDPDKSLSVVLKTLSRDGYIRPAGRKGLRTVLWGLTEIGLESLERRAALAAEATLWLEQNPSYRDAEQPVLLALRPDRWLAISEVAEITRQRVLSVRKALYLLTERGLAEHDEASDEARLNSHGQYEAARIRMRLWEASETGNG